MTQTIEYVVKVNASAANAAVAEVEKRFGGLDNVVSKIDKGIIALERDMKDLDAAIRAGGPNVARYREELAKLSGIPVSGALDKTAVAATNAGSRLDSMAKGAKDMAARLGPAAGAISSVSASLGAAGGEAGKFVAAGGQIVAAFGAGGPVGAAIVAGTVAVDAFSASLLKVEKAREKAFEKDFEKQHGNLLRMAKATQVLNEELRALKVDIMYSGVDGGDRAIIVQQEQAMKLQADADALYDKAGSWNEMSWKTRESMRADAHAMTVQATRLNQIVDDNLKLRGIEIERRKEAEAKAKAEARFTAAIEGQKKAYEAMYKYKADGSYDFGDGEYAETDLISRTMMDNPLNASSDEWLDKMRQEAVAHRHANLKTAAEKELETKKYYNELEVKHKKDTADAILAIDQTYANSAIEVATGTFSTMLSVGQGYIDAKIRGEEDAEQKAVASFLSATGQQLVASGTRALFEGAMISLNPLTPGLGTPLMIAGGASIAAGLAMGAGGSAVASSIPASGAGGGSGSRDPGASPRSSGGSGGGGPMIINVSYGAGGPLPEDIAREIHKVTSSGNRRRGAA